jgi:hypothetical protein
MALLDFGGSRATRLHEHPPPLTLTDAQARQSTWQRTGFEVAETFLVLIGIGIGILTLRFVLVLMHGFLH